MTIEDITAADQARRRAADAVVQAWMVTGWPRPPRRGGPFAHVRACLIHYAELRLTPTFTVVEQRAIVESALVGFMARVHLQQRPVDPHRLVDAVHDEALEHWRAARRAATDDVTTTERSSEGPGETDEQLVQRLFGAAVTAELVQRALSALLRIGPPWAYLVVIQYLDLAHLHGEQVRVREVLTRLRAPSEGWNLSCHDVTEAIITFRERVTALSDAHTGAGVP